MNISDSFCHYPWTGLFIGAHGDVRNCCPSRSIIGNLNDNTLENIINNDLHKEIQNSILDGQWHKNCNLCKEMEESGQVSYRNTGRPIKDFFDVKSLDVPNPNFHIPKIIDIRWSNTCNLACNYCSEKFSSTWAAIKKIDIGASKKYYSDVIQYLSKNSNNIQALHLLGGEPLLIKENADLLANFDNKDVEVNIVTSGSVDLSKSPVFKELRNFKNVNFSISFENTHDRYEYVRHNASWNLLYQNLQYIKDNTNFRLCAVPIYNVYSAFDLVNFYNVIVEGNKFHSVVWNQLIYPMELNLFNFPNSVKNLAIEQLDIILDKYKYSSIDIDLGCDFLKTTRNLLKTSPVVSEFQEFLSFTEDLETNLHVKKHSFFELWPEINF